MDAESWIQGYFAGVALHNHLRTPQVRPSAVATMSATGITGELNWLADLSGVAALTLLTAEYTGTVTVSYSYDNLNYAESATMAEFLNANPASLFSGCNPDTPRIWFRFRLSDNASLAFTLWGIPGEEAV